MTFDEFFEGFESSCPLFDAVGQMISSAGASSCLWVLNRSSRCLTRVT
jgi:hypothetical protein